MKPLRGALNPFTIGHNAIFRPPYINLVTDLRPLTLSEQEETIEATNKRV